MAANTKAELLPDIIESSDFNAFKITILRPLLYDSKVLKKSLSKINHKSLPNVTNVIHVFVNICHKNPLWAIVW